MNANDVIKLNEEVIKSWNAHDTVKFLTYCDQNITWTDVAVPQPYRGKEGAGKFFDTWLKAFPDLKIKVINTIATPDSIAVELEFSGTNTGQLKMSDMPGIPATNKKVIASKGAYLGWIKDGKFVRVNTYPDMAGMMAQLGLLQEAHVG
jgi:steroid delta-isomerase-like uncharacterized protein